MFSRITMILFTLLASLPAYCLSYLLYKFFPHIPNYLYYAIMFGTIVGGGYYFISQKRKFYIENDMVEGMPSWLGNTPILYLVVGTFIGTCNASGSNRSTLYVDNGTDREISFKVKNEGDFKVFPKNHITIPVVTGESTIEIEGKTKVFNLKNFGTFIFNIDSQNVYLKTTIKYTDAVIMRKDGTNPADSSDLGGTIIKNEFFEPQVTYLFDVPDKISVDKNSSGKDIERTALIRINKE